MSEIKVIAREAFYIKLKELKPSEVEKLNERHTHMFFEEKACTSCEWNEDRLASSTKLSEACPNCAAFKGGVTLTKEVKIGDNTYLSIPGGDRQGIKDVLRKHDLKFKSKREETPFKRKIKFTGELRDYQVDAVEAIRTKKYGVIKAPPRSGKTVLSTAAICKIGMKTIIMAAQREWLDGFYETFCGSPTQKALTNAKKSQVGFAKTLEDFKKYDVCLVTYQTFNSEKGKKLLRKIRDMFTVCVIDEVHMGAATNFAICISRLNVKYRIGLSGTPSRKDKRFIIVEALIGPIIFEAKVKRLQPRIQLVRTQFKRNFKGRPQWPTMVAALEKDPQRLKLIAKWAIKDAKAGHMVIIPFAQVTPIKALVMAINKMAGKRMAHPFHGQLHKKVRKQLIEDARNYKARILVGNTKLLSTGINIPRASALYDCHLSSNMENCEQRVSRILTPWDDKPPPMLRIFLDEMDVRKRCLSNEWFNCIKPKFRPVISEVDEKVLKGYFAAKKEESHAAWEL